MVDNKAIALERRLDFIGLDAKARAALVDARPVVERALPVAIAAFYEQLGLHDQTRSVFGGPEHMAKAQQRQIGRWGGVLSAHYDEAYLKDVRAIAEAHVNIGFKPEWAIGGYARILDEMVRSILATHWPKGFGGKSAQREKACDAIGAVTWVRAISSRQRPANCCATSCGSPTGSPTIASCGRTHPPAPATAPSRLTASGSSPTDSPSPTSRVTLVSTCWRSTDLVTIASA